MKKISSLGPVTGLLKDKIPVNYFNGGTDINSIIINLLSGDNLGNIKRYLGEEKRKNYIISHTQEIIAIFTDKLKTKLFLENLGFLVTKGKKLNNFNDLYKEIEDFNFPLILKETKNFGGIGIYFLNNKDKLYNFDFKKNQDYIIEEFVEGVEYSGNIFVHNLNKNDINGEKSIIILPPVEKGKTGINIDGTLKHSLTKDRTTFIDSKIDQEIRKISEEIGKIKGVNGFLEIEFILDNKTNELKIIEINPRISGTFNMSLESGNYNIVEILDLLKTNPDYSSNILTKKILLEYSVQHNNKNFKDTDLNLLKGSRIISKKNFRNFPPFLELFLIEFMDKESFIHFLKLNNKHAN